MKQSLIGLSAAMMAGMFLAGCTDNNYDLSDIDTTSRLSVNQLVLPVNIDPIELGDIIKFDSGSKIQPVTIDDKEFYALLQDGKISSDDIELKEVKAKSPTLNPTSTQIDIDYPAGGHTSAHPVDVACTIEEVGSDFDYSALNIDSAIESIDSIDTKPFKFAMTIFIKSGDADISKMTFRNVRIRAPKGLTCTASHGKYNRNTGLWEIPELVATGDRATISLTATAINTVLAGAPLNPIDRSLHFDGEFRIESADAVITAQFNHPQNVADLILYYTLEDFEATAFSGRINYTFDGITIPPVSLSDVPDFMSGNQSNIELANPQIYVNVNNPVSKYGVYFNANLELEAVRNSVPNLYFTPSREIKVTSDHNAGPYNFLLGTNFENRMVPVTPVDFNTNLEFVPFPKLAQLLTTPEDWTVKGLPKEIDITLQNPRIPSQPVKHFKIEDIPGLNGYYSVVIPLALKDGSYIYYSERRDGWNDEGDLDKLTVTELEISAHAVNNCPVDLQLTVYPLITDPNDSTVKYRSGAKLESTVIPANQEDNLVIKLLDGEVTRLDGFDIEAVLTGGAAESPLSPNQTLKLTDIRAKVSGYYDTDF